MKLSELLKFVDTHITLEISGAKKKYATKADISETCMNFEVTKVGAADGGITVQLAETKKAATLEEQGYSFETGV